MGYQKLKGYEPVVDTCPGDKYFMSNIDPQVLKVGKADFAASTDGTTFVGAKYDNNYLANVGWEKINETNTGYKLFFSIENINRISLKICKMLREAGHNIVVTPEVITGVMSDVLRKHTPEIGDLYTRYTIPLAEPRNDLSNMNDRVVNIIVNTIINEEDARKWNESLTVWDTVYGDFNRRGLRAHSIIRKRENDYMKGQFNMNY
jgi:hypothetical protein